MTMMERVFISGKPLSELVSLFGCDIKDDDDFYFVLAYNISITDADYLLMHIDEYDGARLKGAIFGIGFRKKKNNKQRDILLSLLSHLDPLIIAEALDALRRSRHDNLWKRVVQPLLHHKSPYVKGAALR
jgi:hypothetical protein